MKIENNTRAACYLQKRRRAPVSYPALQAWEHAARHVQTIATRTKERDTARDALALLWEKLGKVEPKRYSGEGEALHKAREAARRAANNLHAVTCYTREPNTAYVGTWQPDQPGQFYMEDPGAMFRDVVTAEDAGAVDHSGWYDNPYGESARDGSGLVFGMVAQLPGKRGRARYVAGYQYGSTDNGGATFDLGTVYESHGECPEDARLEAARAADELARIAGEAECEYQTAWTAGQRWADLGEEIATTRADTLELLRQNRESGGSRDLPAIHATIRDAVCAAWARICEARAERAKLAAGDAAELYFYSGEDRLREAFCEGASIDWFPV